MADWNDYASYSTEELVRVQADIKRRMATGEVCDNDAPGTCCNDCNYYMIVAELTERLSGPVQSNPA